MKTTTHIIAKAGKAKLSYDGCFLTFKDEERSMSIRLVDEGRIIDTQGEELYIAELLRLITAKMKEVSHKRKHILPYELTHIGIAWGSFELCACPALMMDILFSFREIGFLNHHEAKGFQLEHYSFTGLAIDFLHSIPKRRKRARLEVTII